MEQRLLLSANLYDPAATAPNTNSVQEKISNQIVSTLNQLGNLGDALNSDFDGTLVPLIDQSIGDVAGGRIGDFFKFAAGNDGIANYLNGATPNSTGLALVIQTALSDFGLSGTVTDLEEANPSSSLLNLRVDLSVASSSKQVDLRLGEAEEELNVVLEEGTQVDLTTTRTLSFRIMADLSSVATGADLTAQLNGLGDTSFWIDLTDGGGSTEGFTVQASSLHTSTTAVLPEFGVQVGILGMRETGSTSGAYALGGSEFRLNLDGEFDFTAGANRLVSDDRIDLAELKSFQTVGNWSDAYTFSAPTLGGANSASLKIQVVVADESGVVPTPDTYIGGLGGGVTGLISFRDTNLFDDSAPLVNTDGTLASFARLTSQDILNMAGGVSGWAAALQASSLYTDNVPFLDLSTGDAYALGEAFQTAFLAQLQNVEQVLTAKNAPSTWRIVDGSLKQDPLDFTGATSFMISVGGGAWVQVTVTADPARNTLDDLAAALNLALVATGVQARVRDTNSPRLEFFAAEGVGFVMSAFAPNVAGTLDFGFNTLQQLALANNSATAFGGGVTSASDFQLPGIVTTSSADVNVDDFKQDVRTLTVSVNGAAAVPVSIPIHQYSSLSVLVSKIQNALETADLFDPITGDGIHIQQSGNGVSIFGGGDVHSLQLSGDAAPLLRISTAAQTSGYLEFKVNNSPDETYRTYIAGNLTSDILGAAANAKLSDLVSDIQFALVNSTFLYRNGVLVETSPLLDKVQSKGIDIRGSVDGATNQVSLQFFARNPGTELTEIETFSITAQSSGLAKFGFANTDSLPFVSSDQRISPNFNTVQEFAQRVSAINMGGGVTPSFDTGTLTFTFPVNFDYSANPLLDDPLTPQNEGVRVDLNSNYGKISNLTTDSQVEVSRTLNSSFDFQFSLLPQSSLEEALEVGIPIVIYNWDGQLTNDAIITVVMEDGVEHELAVTAASTTGNLETQDFVDQLNAAIASDPEILGQLTVTLSGSTEEGTEILRFQTTPTPGSGSDNRLLRILARPDIASPLPTPNAAFSLLLLPSGVTVRNTVESEIIATGIPLAITLDSHAIFDVALLDGTETRVFLDYNETTANATLDDLVDDINFAFEQNADLSTPYDGTKIEAFLTGGGEIALRLNAVLFPADGVYATEDWSIEVYETYRAPSPNGAFTDLGFSESTYTTADGAVPLTALSGALTGNDPYRLTSPAVLLISVNGSDYTTVTIPAGSFDASISDLIADINTALTSSLRVVEVETPTGPVTVSNPLSDYLRAVLTEDGTGVAIRSLALPAGDTNQVISLRVRADGSDTANTAITQLGFPVDETRAGWRGGEVFLDNVNLTGSAIVTGEDVTAAGTFGFAEFEAATGMLDLEAKSSVLLVDGISTRFSLNRLNDLVSSNLMESVAVSSVDPITFVSLVLSDLTFTGDAVAGLDFDPTATIALEHIPTGSGTTLPGYLSRITDFGALPNAYVTYTNTGGLENLAALSFNDVFQSLLRSAEFISDQMKLDPDGSGAAKNAYSTKLLFVKESLANAFGKDFGRTFETALNDLVESPPRTLQDVESALILALSVTDLSLLSIALTRTYTSGGDPLDSANLESASLELRLPFFDEDSTALDLSIDLNQLGSRSSDPEIVRSYLANLDTLSSSKSNPLIVNLDVRSELDLRLGVEFFTNANTITPKAILRDTTTIDTYFNLAGDSFNGDLPIGKAKLRLSNGQVAINESGEVEINDRFNTAKLYNEEALKTGYTTPVMVDVAAATTADLRGISAGNTLTSQTTGALVVDGVTLAAGSKILVNNQEDNAFDVAGNFWTEVLAEARQNGVYTVTTAGDDTTAWVLTRDASADTASELNGLYVHVTGGTEYAGRNFLQTNTVATMNVDSISFAKLIDPAVFNVNVEGDFQLPYAVRVATTTALNADYAIGPEPSQPAFKATLTSTTNQSINAVSGTLRNGRTVTGIDTIKVLRLGDLVLVKDQGGAAKFHNGVYRVTDVGESGASGRSWIMERVDFADSPEEMLSLRIAVQEGDDNDRVTFVQDTNLISSISAGADINFSSFLPRVYQDFNTVSEQLINKSSITPNGQAQAYLPLVIVVTEKVGDQVVERVISKDTSQLTAAQANDVAFMATQPDFDPVNIRVTSYGGRSGLDRMFDLNVEANTPGVPAPVVFFSNPNTPADELPNLGANLPNIDVLNMLRDSFLMGDALDLMLFNLQFALDQELGNDLPLLGRDLPTYTLFVESWRSNFTRDLREKLINDKLKPINAILDAMFTALGPGGQGFISTRNQITVETVGNGGTTTVWNPANAENYDFTAANERFEKSPPGANAIQFSVVLNKVIQETVIDEIYLGEEVGITISNRTTVLNGNNDPLDTRGGVNLTGNFNLNLGFGVDLEKGFYAFNPNPAGALESIMSVDIQAVLDGDINNAGIQKFTQGGRYSKLHLLDIQLADAADINAGGIATPDDSPGSLDASGFYGTFNFYLNSGEGDQTDDGRVTLTDMQELNTLGIDRNTALPADLSLSQLPYGMFSTQLNGDADIHFLVQGGKFGETVGEGGGIPEIQTELYYQARYGTGSSLISFYSNADYSAAIAAGSAGTATPAQEGLAAQPSWRNDRTQLVNEADGIGFGFTNITIDAEGFIRGTIFEMLLDFSAGFSNIRPVFDFLTVPIPGTEWMAQPFVLGDIFGPKFVAFSLGILNIDNIIKGIAADIALSPDKPDWAKPRVPLTTGNIFSQSAESLIPGSKSQLTKERERIDKYIEDRDLEAYGNKLKKIIRNSPNAADTITDDKLVSQSLKAKLSEKLTTPNKFSTEFEKFRDKGFAIKQGTGRTNYWVNKVKSTANQGLIGTDDRSTVNGKGRTSTVTGITGGGIRLDALKLENINKILRGQEANLSYLELPRLELGVAYNKSVPLPAFPPLIYTFGASLSINAHLKFGWDTQGFYWSTLDTDGNPSPAFGVSARFYVGVGINVGLAEAGIQAFFQLDLDFNWNDVTVNTPARENGFFDGLLAGDVALAEQTVFGFETTASGTDQIGYGKLRQSQIDFLKNLPGADAKAGNLFDVTLTGTVGLTFYVDLTIPIPFVGPITKRIAEKTFSFELFKITWYADKPEIQLGKQTGSTLTLHMGALAARRLFGDTYARNEVFTLESMGSGAGGDNIRITANLQGQTYVSEIFNNIMEVIGYGGGGQSVIDASSLQVATVNLTGGSGNSVLTAGAAAGSILRGGSGTATLNGAPGASTTLIAGNGNTIMYGGTAADTLTSGRKSDLLSGGGGGDTFVFVDNFGRDRLFATGKGNTVDFSAVTADMTYDLSRFVQSAKAANNTIFFAPDAAGANAIDTWISGSGDDRFNTYFFAPNNTINLQGGGGLNTYSVTLGSSYQRFYSDTNPGGATVKDRMDPRNIGYYNIQDSAGTGKVIINQTFPERIAYSTAFINNGREQATMSGIRTVDLNAGNLTVVWGDINTSWVDVGTDSTITAGTIEMQSNVEAQNLTLNLKRGFSITKTLSLRNNSNLTLTIENIDPLANANLSVGQGPGYTDSWAPGIYSSNNSIFSAPGVARAGAPNGTGSGLIRINTPTGGVINNTLGIGAGIIQAANGRVVIQARDTIGYALDPIRINAAFLSAVTRKSFATIAEGINVTSDGNIRIVGFEGLDGLSTASGRLELTVGAGSNVRYGTVFAGGSRDIFFNADELVVDPAGVISTAGNVYFRNITDNRAMNIGGTVAIPDTYNITRNVLNSVARTGQNVAANIVIGRSAEDPISSGVATVQNYDFSQGLILRGSEIRVPGGTGQLTSASKLEFITYESTGVAAGDGSIYFSTTLNPILAPTILAAAFKDIEIDAVILSQVAGGLIQLKAGQGGSSVLANSETGSVTVSATGRLETQQTDANIILFGGINDGDIVLNGSVLSAQDVSLQATGGSITVDAAAIVAGQKLEALAKENSLIRTRVETLFRGKVLGSSSANGENLTIIEADDILLTDLLTDAGNISVNAGGTIHVIKVDASKSHDVSLTTTGALTSENVFGDFNVRARAFTVNAGGSIAFVSDISSLTADAVLAGDITVDNIGGQLDDLELTRVESSNGSITVTTRGNLNAIEVRSLTSSTDNSITLTTGPLSGGNILVDVIDAGTMGDVFLQSGGLNLGGALTWGGTITSDATGTGRITARQLTALAGGFPAYPEMEVINLRTDVANLIARALTGGDPSKKTGPGPDSRADIVIDEANDIRLRRVETLFGDITVNAGGNIVHQAVRSPNREINLTAVGTIDVQLDEALSDGVALLQPKLFGRKITARAGSDITVNTTVDVLDVSSTVSGDVTVTESDSALFESILTEDGDISLTSGEVDPTGLIITKGGNALLGVIRAGATGQNDVTATAYGQMRTSGQTDSGGNLLPGDTSVANAKITADRLTATSYGRMDLLTNIDHLVADNLEFGNIEIFEDNSLIIDHLTSKSGSITVTADDTITALFVESKEDLAQANTFDVFLESLTGDVLIDKITVGTQFNDIIIRADLGNIDEVDPQDLDDSFLSAASSGIDLTADRLDLRALGSIGGIRPLETRINSLEAQLLAAGNIDLNEHDAFSMTSVRTKDGTITIDAGGDIAAVSVVSETDADGNDIRLHSTAGDILVDRIDAGASNGDLFLTSDSGSIDEINPGDAGVDLIADNATLNAFRSIGGNRPIETEFNTLEAHSHSVGNIDLNELDAITLTDIDTANGSVTIDAGGEVTVLDVESLTSTDPNDVTIHNTAGDILVKYINTGLVGADIILTSDEGSIQELAPGSADNNLIGDGAILTAKFGIGDVEDLETRLNFLDAHSLTSGNIDIDEHDSITLRDLDTADGSIEIDANGEIIALDVLSSTDAVANTITLHNTVGNILLDSVVAQRTLADVRITSDLGGIDSLTPEDVTIDLQGNKAILTAFNSIGGNATIDTELNTLIANVLDAGNMGLREVTSVTLEQVATANGNITIHADVDAYANDVRTKTDAPGNDMFLSADGDFFVHQVFAGSDSFTGLNPAAATSISINADRILEWKSDAAVDLRATTLDLNARRDMGTISDPLETSARNIDSVSGLGANAINNYATGQVFVSNLRSTAGPIFFEQFNGTITLDQISAGTGNITLFHNGTENMIINDVATGSGTLRITVRDAGRLQIFRTDITGDAVFQSDELDYFGGFGSIKGTGTLFVKTNNPQNGLFVSPYKILDDAVRVLEYDLIRDRADAFSFTFFLGNVLFFTPVNGMTSGAGGGGSAVGTTVTFTNTDAPTLLLSELINRADEQGVQTGFSSTLPSQKMIRELGFAPAGLSGLPGSLLDYFYSGIFRVNGFENMFSSYFGYHPIGLESLYPDLFDRLADLLEEEKEEEVTPELKINGPQVDSQPDHDSGDRIVATRGEVDAPTPDWGNSTGNAASFLPLAMAGISSRLRGKRNRTK